MNYDSRLIHKPHAQPRLERAAWGLVTAAFWGVYIYLWLPLITLVLWLLGVRMAFFELYARQHQVEPFLIVTIPAIAALCGLALIGWGEYNRRRFASEHRRGPREDVGLKEVAERLGASMPLARQLSQSKITLLRMSDQAVPESMVSPAPPASGAQLSTVA